VPKEQFKEEEIIDNSIIDGEPEPDTVTDSEGRVTAVDEEIVDTTEPSKVEEPVEAPPDTEQERSEHEKRFYEMGLDKQFKGGMDEMLRRIPDMNSYITSLEKERNEYRRQLEGTPKEEPKAPSPDDFYNDPVTAINRIMDDKMSTVNSQIADMRVQTFIASKPDYGEMEPLMLEQLQNNPGLRQLGIDAYPVLYQMAKATQLNKVADEAAKKAPVTVPDKSAAESTVGKKTTSPPTDSMEYWRNKSLKDIENEAGFSGD
jgi:hypothetical protein